MRKIKLMENMYFYNKNGDKKDIFHIRKWHYYEEGKKIWCAFTEDGFILPLTEVAINDYSPILYGEIVNEEYELEW